MPRAVGLRINKIPFFVIGQGLPISALTVIDYLLVDMVVLAFLLLFSSSSVGLLKNSALLFPTLGHNNIVEANLFSPKSDHSDYVAKL